MNIFFNPGPLLITIVLCILLPALFSDLSCAKAEIVLKIQTIIKKKKLTQAKAAKILKISQPKISLLRGYLEDFSLEHLLRFLNDLDHDVYIRSTSNVRIAALGK